MSITNLRNKLKSSLPFLLLAKPEASCINPFLNDKPARCYVKHLHESVGIKYVCKDFDCWGYKGSFETGQYFKQIS